MLQHVLDAVLSAPHKTGHGCRSLPTWCHPIMSRRTFLPGSDAKSSNSPNRRQSHDRPLRRSRRELLVLLVHFQVGSWIAGLTCTKLEIEVVHLPPTPRAAAGRCVQKKNPRPGTGRTGRGIGLAGSRAPVSLHKTDPPSVSAYLARAPHWHIPQD